MHVTYTPADGDRQEWDFDPDDVRASEAERIELRWKGSWQDWSGHVQTGSVRARRLLLWHLLRREHASLKWEDTPDFRAGEIQVQFSAAEIVRLRARVDKAGLPEEDKATVLAALDSDLAEATAREGITADEVGEVKAL